MCHCRVNIMLPGYDRHGRRVFVQRLSIADPAEYKPADVMKVRQPREDLTQRLPVAPIFFKDFQSILRPNNPTSKFIAIVLSY